MQTRKMVLMNLANARQQWRNRHKEGTYGHGERGEEGEMYGKCNMETCISICKIDSQQETAVWLRKLKQGLCINLEGWDGVGGSTERTHVYLMLVRVDAWQRQTQFCKAIILQLKIN